MKVGILTFHASHNYGSMLQAYALQHVLTKLGVENEIINFRSDIQKSLISPPISVAHLRSSLSKIMREPVKTLHLLKKYNRFEKFLKNDLNTSIELNMPKDVETYVTEQKFDALITGSDQIWNPDCWDFDLCYALNFQFFGNRIAYAPSLGLHPGKISESKLKPLIKAIDNYDFISTREKNGSDFINAILGRQIETVLDPTLLLEVEYYTNIQTDVEVCNEPYILYYTPREHYGWFEKAKQFAEKVNMKILITQDFIEYEGANIIRFYDCGPREFISVVKNASICVGDSFHLLAFSLIFQKEFYLLSNELDSRMINILEPLNLQSRLIIGQDPIRQANVIDYVNVKKKLEYMQELSLKYLKRALS